MCRPNHLLAFVGCARRQARRERFHRTHGNRAAPSYRVHVVPVGVRGVPHRVPHHRPTDVPVGVRPIDAARLPVVPALPRGLGSVRLPFFSLHCNDFLAMQFVGGGVGVPWDGCAVEATAARSWWRADQGKLRSHAVSQASPSATAGRTTARAATPRVQTCATTAL